LIEDNLVDDALVLVLGVPPADVVSHSGLEFAPLKSGDGAESLPIVLVERVPRLID